MIESIAALILAATLALMWAPSPGVPPSEAPQTPASAPTHVIAQPDALIWRGQGGGLQTAIAEGSPQAAGPFTMMLRLPDRVWIQPHFHNVDKRLVVIKGELLMGHADTIDTSKVTAIKTGGIAVMPAGTHHYEGGRGETIVALIANGPFTTTMVQADKAALPAGDSDPGDWTYRRPTNEQWPNLLGLVLRPASAKCPTGR